ncbi:hypothetical protein GWI76_10270 [Proteus sp. G2659]|uniref:hypothetical protein n=1 Tax=Proteus sp. G2659 TaxID=2698872 RepID=UPI001929F847|nr:hypothetical protein [Proteus sp. G2659]NBM79638.1 hypothetical protein [Proteus sp. G2659]
MAITLKVYKDSEEYKEYNNARFPRTGNYTIGTPATFEFKGHRWRYEATSFDDNGDYDLLWRPDGKETELMESDASLRDRFAMAAMQGILANPAQLDNVNDKSAELVSRDAYRVADAMLKARG